MTEHSTVSHRTPSVAYLKHKTTVHFPFSPLYTNKLCTIFYRTINLVGSFTSWLQLVLGITVKCTSFIACRCYKPVSWKYTLKQSKQINL